MGKMRMLGRAALVCGVAIPALAALPAWAADAAAGAAKPAGDASEIVVTATKRGEATALSTPIAIQAISGEALARKGVSDFASLALSVPGFQLEQLGPGDSRYVIRGIQSKGASTVGVYYDEAVISGNNANDGGGHQAAVRMYDIERVEVLRGPQGTLFGAGSESGTVRFITKKPQLSGVDGYVHAELSTTHNANKGNYDFDGAVNLPIIDGKLALRAVAWSVNDSGYITQPRALAGAQRGINNDSTLGGRAMLRWVPEDGIDIVASVTHQRTTSNGSSRYTPAGTTSFGGRTVNFGTSSVTYGTMPGGDLVNTDLIRSPWEDSLNVYSLTGNFKVAGGTLTATANWFDRFINFNFDGTPIMFYYAAAFGIPTVLSVTQEPQTQTIQSSEIRYASNLAGPFNFVLGGFRQVEHNNLTVHVLVDGQNGDPVGPWCGNNSCDFLGVPGGSTIFGRYDNRQTTSYAGFFDGSLKLAPKLTLNAGLRYFSQSLKGQQMTTHPFGGFGPSPLGELADTPSNYHKLTTRVNLSYQVDATNLLYATVSQGFRSGGLNAKSLPFMSGVPDGYGPDSLWNYEVGAKGKIADGLVVYDLDVYRIDWKNIQIGSVDPTGAFNFVTNAGAARVTGFEGSLSLRPTKGLRFTLAGSVQDAHLTQDQPSTGDPNNAKAGQKLANVPKYQGSFDAEYSAPLSPTVTGTLGATLAFRGATNTQTNTASPFNVPLNSYALLNLRASLAWESWTATIFARNLTDKRAEIDAISSSQDPLARITVQPRTFGVGVSRRF